MASQDSNKTLREIGNRVYENISDFKGTILILLSWILVAELAGCGSEYWLLKLVFEGQISGCSYVVDFLFIVISFWVYILIILTYITSGFVVTVLNLLFYPIVQILNIVSNRSIETFFSPQGPFTTELTSTDILPFIGNSPIPEVFIILIPLMFIFSVGFFILIATED